jgi:tRNA U34 2-thiouridine synthase MnmA/TrmU
VGSREELGIDRLLLQDVSFTRGRQPEEPMRTDVKLRYRGANVPALITPLADGTAQLDLLGPGSVAPGQAVVFYGG